MNEESYPVTVQGELEEVPSRGLWLVKWILLVPHIIVIAALAVVFIILTIIAWFAILFTGRYPKGIFDFNVGVLRWSWRIGFYGYSALATDKYPPFSLDKDSEFPADLDVEYPEKLSRGLIFVKWLLAVPHFAVLAVLVGSAHVYDPNWGWPKGAETQDLRVYGLLWILIAIVAIVLLFVKKYSRDIFKLVLGINKWSYRVLAYVFLMTDKYPPFRL